MKQTRDDAISDLTCKIERIMLSGGTYEIEFATEERDIRNIPINAKKVIYLIGWYGIDKEAEKVMFRDDLLVELVFLVAQAVAEEEAQAAEDMKND